MPYVFLRLDDARTRRLGLPVGRGVPIRTGPDGKVEGLVDLPRIVRDIEAYREEHPGDADYDSFLATYYHHNAVTLANAGHVAQAYPLLERARELAPGEPQILADLARAAFDLGQYEEARLRYEALIEQPTASQDLFDGLARTLSCLGNHEEALAVARRGCERFPQEWAALNTLTTVLYHAGQLADLDKALFDQLSAKPDDVTTLEKLGVLFRQTGRYPEAQIVIERARRIEPHNARLVYQAGMLAFMIGDHARAEKEFAEALRLNPRHVDSLVSMGLLQYARNHPEAGREMLERAEEVAPKDYRAPLHLGLMAIRTGEKERAKECLSRALALRPFDRAAVQRVLYVSRDEGWTDLAAEAEAQLGVLPGEGGDGDM